MKIPPMTILPIGRLTQRLKRSLTLNKGFTFIEVMVALIILSTGIVTILKVFIVSLDQLSYLGNRVYATIALDNKMIKMSRGLSTYNALAIHQLEESESIDTGPKNVEYKEELRISEVPGFSDLFLLDSTISWNEKGRTMQLARSVYLSNIHFAKE